VYFYCFIRMQYAWNLLKTVTTLKNISHILEYILLRTIQTVLTLLPRRFALFLGGNAGLLLYHLHLYRRIVRKNMEHVALWNKAEIHHITRSLYRNIGRYAIDFLRPAYPIPEHTIYNYDTIEPLFNKGRGTIAILGHLGNWELLSTVFGEKTGRLHVVAKPMNNSIVDDWLLKKRTASSVTTIYTKQALRKMFQVLKKDGIIAILIDQTTKTHGTPVPFLGKDAQTVRTVAGLVQKTGCSVVSTNAIMREDGSYDVYMVTVPEAETEGLSEEEIINSYQRLHNDVISEQIREYPEHWFGWFHRRYFGYVAYREPFK
jgi:Kdo2-lipid IVA lauroyltransferase/acyltransferase